MKKHRLLKIRAKAWLKDLGYSQIQCEKPFILPPDHPEWENEQLVKLDIFGVHPLDGSTIGVECGYIDSDKARKLSCQLNLLMIWPHARYCDRPPFQGDRPVRYVNNAEWNNVLDQTSFEGAIRGGCPGWIKTAWER